MSRELPPPYSGTAELWAEDLSDYLVRSSKVLPYLTSDDRATEDGILLWDQTGYPVVSKDGSFRQIVLADGHGAFSITSDVTFAATGTGYALTYSASPDNHGISQSGSQIIFDEAGHYLVSFSAQIYSTSASTVNFVFWPKFNGANMSGSTMRNALHANGSALVVARTVMITADAGDYIEAYAAVDSTSGSLKAFPANAIATEPATPASTLTVIRVHQ